MPPIYRIPRGGPDRRSTRAHENAGCLQLAILTTALLLGGVALAQMTGPSRSVSDQVSNAFAVTIGEATLDQGGFVVVHAIDTVAAAKDGFVVVHALEMGQVPAVGDHVFAMVHVDDGDGA